VWQTCRQIFDGGFTRTGRLHIHDPLCRQTKAGIVLESGAVLEGGFEPVAEAGGQDDLRQEESR